jgi:hypothetical protein
MPSCRTPLPRSVSASQWRHSSLSGDTARFEFARCPVCERSAVLRERVGIAVPAPSSPQRELDGGDDQGETADDRYRVVRKVVVRDNPRSEEIQQRQADDRRGNKRMDSAGGWRIPSRCRRSLLSPHGANTSCSGGVAAGGSQNHRSSHLAHCACRAFPEGTARFGTNGHADPTIPEMPGTNGNEVKPKSKPQMTVSISYSTWIMERAESSPRAPA